MKTTKKIIAFAAALSLSACMMAMPMGTAWAAPATGTNSVTIEAGDGDDLNHSGYVAYQIFEGDYSAATGLTVKGWGSGINTGFIKALKDSNDFGSPNLFASVGGDNNTADAASAQAVADIIRTDNSAFTAEMKEAFARLALKYAKYGNANAEYSSGTNTDKNKISNLPDGYYVVADKAAASTTNGDKGFTLGLLIAGGQTMNVTTKVGYPKVEKKVEENVKTVTGKPEHEDADYSGGLNDVADYNIGDSVPFKLYGTMPSNLDKYGAYYYKFSDTLSAGLDLPEEITVNIGTTSLAFSKNGNTYSLPDGATDKNCRVAVATVADGRKTITISFEDVKKYSGVSASTVITVSYASKLNSSAVIGLDGNLNTVRLSYLNNPNLDYRPNTDDDKKDGPRFDDNSTPNNPYDDTYKPPTNSYNPDSPGTPDGPYDDTDKPDTPRIPDSHDGPDPNSNEDSNNPHTSTSTEDKVIVFTYELDVTKIDAATEAKLQGAKFKLAKGDITVNNGTIEYATIASGAITWDTTGTELVSNNEGLISVKGLDDGTYTLVETAQPTGYNDPGNNNMLVFKIDATTVNGQGWNGTAASALTALKVTKTAGTLLNSLDDVAGDVKTIVGDTSTGVVSFDVKNTKGATLPTTGGIGTTIFLLTGGAAAGAAAVIYIARKRTSASES